MRYFYIRSTERDMRECRRIRWLSRISVSNYDNSLFISPTFIYDGEKKNSSHFFRTLRQVRQVDQNLDSTIYSLTILFSVKY